MNSMSSAHIQLVDVQGCALVRKGQGARLSRPEANSDGSTNVRRRRRTIRPGKHAEIKAVQREEEEEEEEEEADSGGASGTMVVARDSNGARPDALKKTGRARKGHPKRRQKKRTRPSLSEQLAQIGMKASSVTDDLRRAHGLEPRPSVTFSAPARRFVVGKLESKVPGVVDFHSDCCRYTFYHPHENKQIEMTMYYADMRRAALRQDVHGYRFCFHVPNPLRHYGRDYDPGNRAHGIEIHLSSELDANRVRKTVLKRR